MADISVKMGVTGVSQFRQSMAQGAQSVKTLDAALKKNEAQFKATGDAETYMATKSKLLEQQIKAQKGVVEDAQKALELMAKSGVEPASKEYQKMQQQLLNAQTALLNMQTGLQNVGTGAREAATGADDMNKSLKNIGKQVSFQSVIEGVGKITDGMEKAARSVAHLAAGMWDTMRDAASWADDQQTLADMYGIDVETLQRMEKTAEKIDTPVEAIIKARQKLTMGISGGFTADQMEVLSILGLTDTGKYGTQVRHYDSALDMLWDAGNAMMNMGNAIDRDAYAQQLFGKSWMELMPMFKAGREEYERTMASWSVVSEKGVEDLGGLDDAMGRLEEEFSTLKLTVLESLAPAFNDVSTALADILQQVNAYLQTDEGQEKLKTLGDAVVQLFDGLTNIDTGQVIKTVGDALNAVTGALTWVMDNKEDLVTAIEAIAAAWGAMKAAELAANIGRVLSGLTELLGGGAGKDVGDVVSDGIGGGLLAGLGAKLAGGAKAIGAFLGKAVSAAVPWLGPIAVGALAIGGVTNDIIQEQRLQEEARAERARRIAVREELTQAGVMADPGYAEIYNLFSDLDASGANPYEALAERYRAWWYEDMEDKALDALLNITDDNDRDPETISLFDRWAELIEGYLNGENVYDGSNVTVWEEMRKAIEEAGKEQMLKLPAEVDPDTAALQETLNQAGLTVPVTPVPVGVNGSHANGLNYVPFDGYISILHRGERIVPASQNKSYTANSYLNVESMIMNNGTDVHALAEAMAAETARVQRGFGA